MTKTMGYVFRKKYDKHQHRRVVNKSRLNALADAYVRSEIAKMDAQPTQPSLPFYKSQEESPTMTNEQLAKMFSAASVEKKADVLHEAVSKIYEAYAPSPNVSVRKQQFRDYERDAALSKLVAVERRSMHGPGY